MYQSQLKLEAFIVSTTDLTFSGKLKYAKTRNWSNQNRNPALNTETGNT